MGGKWNTNKYHRKNREQLTMLASLIGIALGLYFLGLALYLISPPWTKEGSMVETLIFLAVALVFIAVVMLWKYVDGLEDRLAQKLKRAQETSLRKKFLAEYKKAQGAKSKLQAKVRKGRSR